MPAGARARRSRLAVHPGTQGCEGAESAYHRPQGQPRALKCGFILLVAIVKPFIRHSMVRLLQGSFLAAKAGEKVFES